MSGGAHDRSGDDYRGEAPWAEAFDPVANVRALGDIQRRGLRAADEIVARLVAAVDGAGAGHDGPWPGAGSDGASGDGGAGAGEGASRPPSGEGAPAGGADGDLERLATVWGDLTVRALQAVAGLAAPPAVTGASGVPGTGPATVDVGTGSAPAALQVRVHRPGTGEPLGPACMPAEVWLHNGTGEARRAVRLHCGELRSADGVVLAARVTFDPPVVEHLPARSSRGVAVAVELGEADLGRRAPTAAIVPGTYRGLVQAAGLPDVWLRVDVHVD